MQLGRHRYWILSEAIGGPDNIYSSRVFARYIDRQRKPQTNIRMNQKI
jgi:hypothetical protein